mgnify:CR=1 FL=1
MKYQKIKGVKHYVYEHISDFYNDHPNKTPLKDWRESKEGDWVWSDDSRIVQILKSLPIRHPNDRRNYKYCKKKYLRLILQLVLGRLKATWMRLVRIVRTKLKRKRQSF